MKKFRHITAVIVTLLICFVFVPVAFAHPLGNFTINQYVGVNISREKIVVDYIVDMAEIPAFQEIAAFDANGNGQADSSESARYHADKCASLQPDLKLLLDNQALDLTLASSSVEFPAGVGGLPTLRLTCGFQSPLNSTKNNLDISFVNNAFPDRLGWKEIVVIPDGVSLNGDFSSASLSNRLTKYPQDLLTSPLQQRRVEFEITSGSALMQNQPPATTEPNNSSLTDRNDTFTRLILLENVNFSTLLLAFAIAFIWGAMHAMTPGHGKTIVGAYLVGSRGTMKHALYLGLTTTITHTLGVFALGLITLFAAQYIVPEKLFPWMSLLSGLFVVGIGINLFTERFKSSGLGSWILSFKSKLVSSRKFIISAPAAGDNDLSNYRSYVLAPSRKYSHSHSPDHHHSHESHDHHHDHDRYEERHHNHAHHSHMPPEAITWRNLLALGISGGIIPCPSALVVLLGAIGLNRIGFGLVLVFAFSLGLAGALTAIGMTFIYAGRLFNRFPSQGKIIQFLPVLSALFVSVIGVGITMKALAEIGIV